MFRSAVFSFAVSIKRAGLSAIIMAAIMLSLLLGQPLYAQTTQPPPSTGKTLSSALLGKPHASMPGTSPFASQINH